MKDEQYDILIEAVNALKREYIPAHPPQETVDGALQRLREIIADTTVDAERIRLPERIKVVSNFTKIAAAAVIILAVSIGSYLFIHHLEAEKIAKQQLYKTEKDIETAEKLKLILEAEKIERDYAAGNVEGLLAVLAEGQYQSKIATTKYLGEIGDTRAIEPLKKLSATWTDNETDNPFDNAIESIEKRLENQDKQNDVDTRLDGLDTSTKAPLLGLTVVNKETQQPMGQVNIDIRINNKKSHGTTDEQGLFIIASDQKKIDYLFVKATANDFVPMQIEYSPGVKTTGIPKEYTLALEHGTSIGGIIQNEDGQPIENVIVFLHVQPKDKIENVSISDIKIETDAQGQWQYNTMPADPGRIIIHLNHPEYYAASGTTPAFVTPELRDMTSVMVMEQGLTVSGYVLDTNNNAIKNARISQGTNRSGQYPTAETDENGRFEFKNIPAGEMVMTVQAAGYAPDLKQITVDDNETIEFRLESGHTIGGQIVDVNDQPISEANVAANSWRGHQSLKWRTNTNKQGRFVWNDAPSDEVVFDMGKLGYMSIRDYAMLPSDDEYIIVMYAPFRITGMVVDADTNEPIKAFKVTKGYDPGYSRGPFWERRSRSFTSGHYSVTSNEPREGYLVRIEADGYKTVVSPVFIDDQDEIIFNVKLQKSSEITGIVITADGQSVSDIELVLATGASAIQIEYGIITNKGSHLTRITNGQGRFSFPVQNQGYMIVAATDQGFAKITDRQLEQTGEIILQRWGQVEGVLLLGKNDGAYEQIVLNYKVSYKPNIPSLLTNYTTQTDAAGHFVLSRLIPGKAKVGWQIQLSKSRYTSSHSVPVEIVPGQTSTVRIGRTGRPVTGTLTVPDDYKEPVNWSFAQSQLAIRLPKPQNHLNMTVDEQKEWYKTWKDSDEGKAYYQRINTKSISYAVVIQPDGSFGIEDVSPGKYHLEVELYGEQKQYRFSELLGTVDHILTVPDYNEVRTDEAFDTGEIELQMKMRLKTGDIAPDFDAQTLQGQNLSLTDYRGKIILLFFYDARVNLFNEKDVFKEIQQIKQVHRDLSDNGQFEIIGIELHSDLETTEKFIKDNDFKWTNCLLKSIPNETVRIISEGYGLDSSPYTSMILVDTDGRIIARKPDIDQLQFLLKKLFGD